MTYTPESLLRLSSLAGPGIPAAHLRTWVSPALGFPLHPLISWRIPAPRVEEIADVVWWRPTPDGPEVLVPPIDLDVVEGPVFAELGNSPDAELPSWWCWVSVEVADPDVPMTVAVADRGAGDRALVQRSRAPHTLGASRITRLRFTGHGQVVGLRGVDAVGFSPPHEPVPVISALPVEGSGWYVGGISVDEALDRAAQAFPSRTGPLDRPFDSALDYDDEYTRVRAMVHVDRTGSRALLDGAYLDGDLPVRHRTVVHFTEGPAGQAGFGTVEALLTGAADPGVARWLGLLGTDPLDEEPEPELPYAWVCAGWWAVDPDRPVTKAPLTTLGDVLGNPSAAAARWARLVDAAFPEVVDLRQRVPFEVRPFVTPVGMGAVQDLPPAPRPELDGPPVWEGRDEYGRRIRLRGPLAGPVALARDGVSRNPRIDAGARTRGVILLPGRADGPAGLEGALSDTEIPADRPVTWTVATADEFGRWGEDGEVRGDPPERPGLPAPVVEAAFVPATGLPPTGTAVPGSVAVQVPVPARLGPGTLPVLGVRISLDGGPPDEIAPADRVTRSYPAPPTAVGGKADVRVSVWFVDARGAGPTASTTVAVRDPRRPAPLVVGPAVLWASRPDPTGGAELALRLPAPAQGWRHHVYLAEETALRRALDLPLDRGRNRAQRAKEIADAAARITDRGLFTMVGPVTGTRFTTTLPGAVRTLRFLRVVPVTPAGREADFAACPLVPVAVPGPDRPPSPALTLAPDGPGLRLTLTVHGLDRAALDRLAPGGAPRYRLRQTLEGTGDPLYLPVVAAGTLRAAGDTWTAEVPVRGLAPFVRHTWQAEVSHPAEIALSAAPRPSTVLPEHGEAGDPAPAAWSAPSAPLSGMVTVPIPALDAQATLPGPVLTLRGAPVAGRGAVGDWRLRVWRRAADGALTPVDPPDGDGWVVHADLAVPDPGWSGEGYALQLVDPLGRTGPLTEIPSPLIPTTTTLQIQESVTGAGTDGAWLTATVSAGSPVTSGSVRFRTGDGIVLGEAPPGRAVHVGFADFGDGTAVAGYLGDGRHAPSTSAPRPLPEAPGEEGPPDGEA